ncbi:MAG: type I-U CRISPR-associated protein Cas7 [Solirubrobacteraceae bacterium]|nr:type I-U CRISPR-associated protein Cas7 [Solirubrobacteraceae bacterium]
MPLELPRAPRLVLDARLRPVAGSSFQPTGFANLGPAEFTRPGGQPSLLVESVQSMANHLEAVGTDAASREPIELLRPLPWIAVRDPEGRLLTSSRLEPHRLASAYLRNATIDDENGATWLADRLGLAPKTPLDMPAIYRAVFELDPLCLIHGVFFSAREFPGNPKIRRVTAATIEAHGVAPLVSGGLKRDDVQFVTSEGSGAEEGYGFVPFSRTEYVADEIVLSAVVDLEQVRGYGLAAEQTRLLELLALWELTSLLDGPLRLRTACDLEIESVEVRKPEGLALPPAGEVVAELASAIDAVTFEAPGERTAVWSPKG